MSEIAREELCQLLACGEELILLDVLPRSYFRHSHLPGAVNLPVDEIATRAFEIMPDRAAPIIVYCLNPACAAAPEAARLLTEMGYQNVREYCGGKQDWSDSGLALEGESRSLQEKGKSGNKSEAG